MNKAEVGTCKKCGGTEKTLSRYTWRGKKICCECANALKQALDNNKRHFIKNEN